MLKKFMKISFSLPIKWMIFLFILILMGCVSKKYTIEGKLVALSSDSPLANVPLKIIHLTENSSFIVVTDSDGKFTTEKVPIGKYRIESADSTAYLVSIDTFEITKKSSLTVNRGTIRGLVAPPKVGLFAWIKGIWRELGGVLIYGDVIAISMKEARNALSVPESASLLAYFPKREWKKNNGIDWVMAVSSDSVIRLGEGKLNEQTPENEPKTMDPYSFRDWNLPGVYPLRGPNFANLYAIVEPLLPNDEGAKYRIYPFWVMSPLSSDPITQFNQSGNIGTIQTQKTIIQGSILDSAVQMDIYQRALRSALAALNLLTTPIPQDTVAVKIEENAPHQNRFTQEQINRWREMLRNSRTDKDTFRRRQLWRAIRDSAEGTDVAMEADRLLMRDINNLPLK
ncbi:MAG: carboxypeptidase-like regulatory domain-containing protein [bacterium]|nr:carboxypeptidase-like regulatory domain-containing protein [bacterium]